MHGAAQRVGGGISEEVCEGQEGHPLRLWLRVRLRVRVRGWVDAWRLRHKLDVNSLNDKTLQTTYISETRNNQTIQRDDRQKTTRKNDAPGEKHRPTDRQTDRGDQIDRVG